MRSRLEKTFLALTMIACFSSITVVAAAESGTGKPKIVQAAAAMLLTPEEFAQTKYASPAQEVSVAVQIHPGFSNFIFHLVPAPEDKPERGLQPVGRIVISTNVSGPPLQTIQVMAEASTDFFIRCFELVDINHDGYLDLSTIAEFGGAKWGRSQYWLFDPKSGRFLTNWLTERLSRFQCNQILPDPASGEIHVRYLVFDGVMDEGYEIRKNRLVLVSKQEIQPKPKAGFVVTTKRMIDNKMQVIKVKKVPDYPSD